MRARRLQSTFTFLLLASLAAGAASSDPKSSPGPEQLLAAGRVDDAVSALQSRIKAAASARDYHLLTQAHLLQQRWDDALSAAEQAVRLEPRNSDYHLWLGRAYGEKASRANFLSAMRLAGRVRDSFERAVELDPNNVAARRDLAEFYIEAPGIIGGGSDKARAQAERVSSLDSAAAYWIHARLAEKDKDHATAEKQYRAAIQASGNRGSYWLDLAGFFRRQQRYAEMEDAIQKAVSAEKRSPAVLLNAAQLLLRAERNLNSAIQLTRTYLDGDTVIEAPPFIAHYVLGTLLEQQGDKAAAQAEYRAALALASNYQPAREALRRVSR